MMRDLHERYPQYGFDRHKGYVTDEHVRALEQHGPCPVHRYSFVNVVAAAGPSDRAAVSAVAAPAALAAPAASAALGAGAGAGAAEAIEALVASGLSPAGVSGQDERRMDS
jgi:ribonuclease HII